MRIGYLSRDLRARWPQELYGDQGLFVRRDTFEAIGGFRPLAIMEDFDLVRRLRRRGRIRVIPYPILISLAGTSATGCCGSTSRTSGSGSGSSGGGPGTARGPVRPLLGGSGIQPGILNPAADTHGIRQGIEPLNSDRSWNEPRP